MKPQYPKELRKNYYLVFIIVIVLSIGAMLLYGTITSKNVNESVKETEPVHQNVLCYGDSNTWGYDPDSRGMYPYEKHWTTILSQKLGDQYTVLAEGEVGRMTKYGWEDSAYLNGVGELPVVIGTHFPLDIVILMLGTNDCLRNDLYGISADDIQDGMEQLINITNDRCQYFQGYKPKIIIVVPGAIRPREEIRDPGPDVTDEAVRLSHEIAPKYKELARKHHCAFIDGSDTFEVSDLDGVHLTEQGNQTVAEAVYEVINSLPAE